MSWVGLRLLEAKIDLRYKYDVMASKPSASREDLFEIPCFTSFLMEELLFLSFAVTAMPFHLLMNEFLQSLTIELVGLTGAVELIYFFHRKLQMLRALLPILARDFIYDRGWSVLNWGYGRFLLRCGLLEDALLDACIFDGWLLDAEFLNGWLLDGALLDGGPFGGCRLDGCLLDGCLLDG